MTSEDPITVKILHLQFKEGYLLSRATFINTCFFIKNAFEKTRNQPSVKDNGIWF